MTIPLNLIYQEVALDLIRPRNRDSRRSTSADQQLLAKSIEILGVLVPILVMKVREKIYEIVDGHRRYCAVSSLELDEQIPFVIRPPLCEADYERLRFELHESVKPWTQVERRRVVKRLASFGLHSMWPD